GLLAGRALKLEPLAGLPWRLDFVFAATGRLGRTHFDIVRPAERKGLGLQLRRGLLEGTTGDNQVRHGFACLRAAFGAVGGRLKADGLHLGRPLAVMIAAAPWYPAMMLPEVHHLMHKRGEDFVHRP